MELYSVVASLNVTIATRPENTISTVWSIPLPFKLQTPWVVVQGISKPAERGRKPQLQVLHKFQVELNQYSVITCTTDARGVREDVRGRR